MRIFENPEDEALQLSREEQVPLAKEPRISPWTELLTPAQKEALPLETFPIIEDFEMILLPWPTWQPSWRKQWGYHFGFFSQQQGLLACFGLSGHAVLEYDQETFRIPLNFWDLEQAWEQVIFEKGEYVYILEGDADDHTCGYHCWFRVRKERYLAEWQLALEACRRIMRQMEGK
ncbi:MAG TPA: hypothetical protein VHZ51_16560 [Ktedonobacteraceae bacterium]|jgi:hypothetical protein|nr:hypothetical protein [Ktedonobacteraceae bacterium]